MTALKYRQKLTYLTSLIGLKAIMNARIRITLNGFFVVHANTFVNAVIKKVPTIPAVIGKIKSMILECGALLCDLTKKCGQLINPGTRS